MIGDKKNNPNKVSNAYDANQSQDCYKDSTSDKNDGLQNCACDKDQSKKNCNCDKTYEVEPLPESSRPRKDGPGGN